MHKEIKSWQHHSMVFYGFVGELHSFAAKPVLMHACSHPEWRMTVLRSPYRTIRVIRTVCL
jgi:hypothetical protein